MGFLFTKPPLLKLILSPLLLGTVLFAQPTQAIDGLSSSQVQALKTFTKAKTIVLPRKIPNHIQDVTLELTSNVNQPTYAISFVLNTQSKVTQGLVSVTSRSIRLNFGSQISKAKTAHPLCQRSEDFRPIPSKFKHLKLPFQINGYCLKTKVQAEKERQQMFKRLPAHVSKLSQQPPLSDAIYFSVSSHFGTVSLSGKAEDLAYFLEILSYLHEI